MKNLITFLLVVLVTMSNAQITLENTYSNSIRSWGRGKTFHPINLSSSGIKYAIIDTNLIELYNLNHSLFKSFAVPDSANSSGTNVFMITESLFDTDSTTIEYLVDNFPYSVRIFREDGTQIFREDTVGFLLHSAHATNPSTPIWTPILPTDTGVKMILNNRDGGTTKVYSLPGTLPECCCGGSQLTGSGIPTIYKPIRTVQKLS